MADKLVLVIHFDEITICSLFNAIQRASLTVNIDLSDVTKYYTVLYRTVVVYEKKNRSLVFSGSRKIPTLGSTVQWETRQASFPTGTVGPRVGIFLSPLNTNDGFYLSHPHTNNGFFFLLTVDYYFKISFQKYLNTLRDIITWLRHFDRTLTSLDDHVREFQYNQYQPFRVSLDTIRKMCKTSISDSG